MSKESIPHFEADISDKGIKMDGPGFTGNQCIKESETLESALGENDGRSYKAAFYKKVLNPLKNKMGF